MMGRYAQIVRLNSAKESHVGHNRIALTNIERIAPGWPWKTTQVGQNPEKSRFHTLSDCDISFHSPSCALIRRP